MSGVHAETITLVVGLFGFMCSLDGVFFLIHSDMYGSPFPPM